MYEARKMWLRENPFAAQAESTETRHFREYFGCPAEVCVVLWNLLVLDDLLPAGAQLQHLLWTLIFLKGYPKTKQFCTLCGGHDKNTVFKWVYAFIQAIPCVESKVVSDLCHCCILPACIR